jgi:hypothetical protein
VSGDGDTAALQSENFRRIAEFCRLGVARTEVDGMALSVLASDVLEPVFSTDALAERVADLQYTLGQGPGTDAATTGIAVLVPDIGTAEARRRWPLFAIEAQRLGVKALHSFPLLTADVSIGEASLYRRVRGGLAERQLRHAATVTGLLTSVMLHAEADPYTGSELRMSVHQAAGMVMQQTGESIADAIALLKATAFVEDIEITGLAREVLNGVRRFEALDGKGAEPDER